MGCQQAASLAQPNHKNHCVFASVRSFAAAYVDDVEKSFTTRYGYYVNISDRNERDRKKNNAKSSRIRFDRRTQTHILDVAMMTTIEVANRKKNGTELLCVCHSTCGSTHIADMLIRVNVHNVYCIYLDCEMGRRTPRTKCSFSRDAWCARFSKFSLMGIRSILRGLNTKCI